MSSLPGAPKLIHAGFVLLDPATAAVTRIIELPLNPEALSRSLDSVPVAAGPVEPREIVSFTAVLDASDALAQRDPSATQNGILPLLSALELLMYSQGPANQQPIILFVWGSRRILPVRVTSMQIVEQVFDNKLNPIQATVSMTLFSLKDADLPANSKARALWDTHLQVIGQLAALVPPGTAGDLGIGAV
jgi:Contractile injection system tube protein